MVHILWRAARYTPCVWVCGCEWAGGWMSKIFHGFLIGMRGLGTWNTDPISSVTVCMYSVQIMSIFHVNVVAPSLFLIFVIRQATKHTLTHTHTHTHTHTGTHLLPHTHVEWCCYSTAWVTEMFVAYSTRLCVYTTPVHLWRHIFVPISFELRDQV